MTGIAIPIGFRYRYRGVRYAEVETYFSFRPVAWGERDLVDAGRSYNDERRLFLKYGTCHFDCLIPMGPKDAYSYDMEAMLILSPDAWKNHKETIIDTYNENPATATGRERIGFYPCTKNNLHTTLDLFSQPDFFVTKEPDYELALHIWDETSKSYVSIPSQEYCPSCMTDENWYPSLHKQMTQSTGTFDHRAITVDHLGFTRVYSDLNWESVARALLSVGP